MIKQFTDVLWTVIALLFQLVLVIVLIALLMGEGAGGFVTSVYGNVRELLVALIRPRLPWRRCFIFSGSCTETASPDF